VKTVRRRVGGRPVEVGSGELADGAAEVVGHDREGEPGGVGHEVPFRYLEFTS
jgi:hypothetical protein